MPFGKYKGRPLDELPTSYLRWLSTRDLLDPLCSAVEDELESRRITAEPSGCARGGIHVNPEDRELFLELVNSGYRQTALKYHPDVGGRPEDMRRLNALIENCGSIVKRRNK
jgi:hypothetical protein